MSNIKKVSEIKLVDTNEWIDESSTGERMEATLISENLTICYDEEDDMSVVFDDDELEGLETEEEEMLLHLNNTLTSLRDSVNSLRDANAQLATTIHELEIQNNELTLRGKQSHPFGFSNLVVPPMSDILIRFEGQSPKRTRRVSFDEGDRLTLHEIQKLIDTGDADVDEPTNK